MKHKRWWGKNNLGVNYLQEGGNLCFFFASILQGVKIDQTYGNFIQKYFLRRNFQV